MIAIFVHGWSVQHTQTYGDLPAWLQGKPGPDGQPIQVADIYLGKYISFDDTVTVDDIARAFDQAIEDELGARLAKKERFACITHSTGGPVIRAWIDLYWKDKKLAGCPLSHLVMLAPANHGSALAQLGKSRLGRIKAFVVDQAEPGERVLDWLELGSELSWKLNTSWLDYDCVPAGLFPFVLTGQTIDRSLYDALNSYTDEEGSDGVVRVAAANLNYGFLRVLQGAQGVVVEKRVRTKPSAMGVLPGLSHSGKDMGIIRSVKAGKEAGHPSAVWVERCLAVDDAASYAAVTQQLEAETDRVQQSERKRRAGAIFPRTFVTNRYSMVVFRVVDDRDELLSDYDLYLTAGPDYSEQHLPPGFFVDRQRNRRHAGRLTYYVDYDVLHDGLQKAKTQGKLGFRLVARPEGAPGQRLAFYEPLDFRSTFAALADVLKPNETLMVELVLRRNVDRTVFRIEQTLAPSKIDPTPSGKLVS
jgi:hypothetical protein